jgi:putative transcriptional regulator
MIKKRTKQALAQPEAARGIWQEVLDGVGAIKPSAAQAAKAEPVSPVTQARQKSGLSREKFAALLGVSIRTLAQWEQGRGQPAGAAKTVLRIAELHPEVLREVAA